MGVGRRRPARVVSALPPPPGTALQAQMANRFFRNGSTCPSLVCPLPLPARARAPAVGGGGGGGSRRRDMPPASETSAAREQPVAPPPPPPPTATTAAPGGAAAAPPTAPPTLPGSAHLPSPRGVTAATPAVAGGGGGVPAEGRTPACHCPPPALTLSPVPPRHPAGRRQPVVAAARQPAATAATPPSTIAAVAPRAAAAAVTAWPTGAVCCHGHRGACRRQHWAVAQSCVHRWTGHGASERSGGVAAGTHGPYLWASVVDGDGGDGGDAIHGGQRGVGRRGPGCGWWRPRATGSESLAVGV